MYLGESEGLCVIQRISESNYAKGRQTDRISKEENHGV